MDLAHRLARRPAYATYSLIGVSVLAFVLSVASAPAGGLLGRPGSALGHLVNADPAPRLPGLVALLGATFLHANALHLLTNALYLAVFGQRVEPLLGPRRFLALFALGAVGSALALELLSPADAALAIGSSGAVAAVIGAYVAQRPYALVALLTPRAFRTPEEIVPVTLLLLWLASQFLSGLAALASGTMSGADGSLWAHLGGFATGLVLGPLFRLGQWRTLRV